MKTTNSHQFTPTWRYLPVIYQYTDKTQYINVQEFRKGLSLGIDLGDLKSVPQIGMIILSTKQVRELRDALTKWLKRK